MDFSPRTNPVARVGYLIGFLVLILVAAELTGVRSHLSPVEIRALFWEYH